ncbi:melanoma cell adhesion molecule b isoform 2-T2 [Clarias gariepinus]
MSHRKVTIALTGLYVLIWQVCAKLEVSMEDRIGVFLDDMAEIPCIYNMSGSTGSPTIQWFIVKPANSRTQIYYKSGSNVIEGQGTGYLGRIKVSHSQDGTIGNSLLTITSVQVADSRDFICQVDVDGDSGEGLTQLQVYKSPSPPEIEPGTYASLSEQRKVASCLVSKGYPSPTITWYKHRTPLRSSSNVKVLNSQTVNSDGLITVRSDLYLTAVMEDKDALFYCQVTYPGPGAEKMIESNQFNITVHYPSSEVTMFKEFPHHLVKEGDTVELRCQGDGYPQPVFSFTHNSETIQAEEGGGRLILTNVTRLNSGLYECSGLDAETFDSIIGNLTLMVHYLDPVVITPKNPDSLNEGQDLSLTCNALSSLNTQTVWYKDNVELHKGNVLALHNASFATAGTYACEVLVSELPELIRRNTVHISVKGKPMISEGVAVIPLDNQKAINVSCQAKGHPTPIIHWSLSDEQAQLGRWDTRTENGILSIISISTTSDITASCRASNDLGTTESSRVIQAIEMGQTTTTATKTTTTTTSNTTSTVVPGTTNPKKIKKVEMTQKPTTAATTTTTTVNTSGTVGNQSPTTAATTTTTTVNTSGTVGGNGYIIAIIIIFILLLAVVGSVLYFMYKKGRLPCGRSGKQDLTKEKASSDDIVVEIKSSKSEEAVLLQGVNGDKKTSNVQ